MLRLDGVIVTHAQDRLGFGVFVSGGTLIMYSGEISGNNNPLKTEAHGVVSGYGGGVSNIGTFVMFGGKITNNTAYRGGGVSNTNFGKFIMYGGTISNNAVYGMGRWDSSAIGGGVYVYESGSFTMFDGIIASNHTDDGDDNVCGAVERFGGEIYGSTEGNNNTDTVEDNERLFYVVICVGVVVIIGVVGFLFLHFKAYRRNDVGFVGVLDETFYRNICYSVIWIRGLVVDWCSYV